MRQPLIGLTGRRAPAARLSTNLPSLSDREIDVYYSNYADAVAAAGGLPVYIPVDEHAAEYVPHLDGLLLTGGEDINPSRYGREVEVELIDPSASRDDYELAMLDAALRTGVPVLGICRGLQLMNVHARGTLLQHVVHTTIDETPKVPIHDVAFEPGSALAEMYGAERSVNSLHHQAIDTLGDDLLVTARSDDGGIEGIEHEHLPAIGVQWHPEMMPSMTDDPIFAWLVDLAAARRRVHGAPGLSADTA